jgi:nuclear pore complex protein Nup107
VLLAGVVAERTEELILLSRVQSSLDPYERALYGAISGDTTSVLPVCTSWEDVVWTHVNALFESHVEAGLWSSSEGRFWSRGSVKSIENSKLDVEDALLGSAGRGASVRGELQAIFDRMLRIEKGELAMSAKNPFHVSQTYLIIGKISDLFTTFVDRLEQAAMETEPEWVYCSTRRNARY